MRTTIRIEERVHAMLKEKAARTGKTMGELVEEAVLEVLRREAAARSERPLELTTFRGRGLRPGVDLDNTAALLDVMEED